jgi:hypothetical protein
MEKPPVAQALNVTAKAGPAQTRQNLLVITPCPSKPNGL